MFVIRWTYLIKKIIVYFVGRSTQKHYIIFGIIFNIGRHLEFLSPWQRSSI